MGIINTINCCLDTEHQPDRRPLELMDQIINNDYSYFMRENWYRFSKEIYFDLNKFIFLFSNYAETQQSLLDLWKIVDMKQMKMGEKEATDEYILSYKWKFAIRRGVPVSLNKALIEHLFRKQLNFNPKQYQQIYRKETKGGKVSIKPNTFQRETQEVFKVLFLNTAGEQALKRITFILTKTAGQLDYCPFLLNLIACLLIFIDEGSSYQLIHFLIDSSFKAKQQSREFLHYHLTLNEFQFENFAEQFYKKIKKISPTVRIINEHLNTEGIQKKKIFKEIVGSFFFGYLPYGVILRIFLVYLNQGISVLYRAFYSIIKISGPAIRDSTTNYQILKNIKSNLFNFLNNQNNIKTLFRHMFDLKLSVKYSCRFHEVESIKSKRNQQSVTYYLPMITGSSQILSYESVEDIWGFLPEVLKHYDLQKIYPKFEQFDFLPLKNLIKSLSEYHFTLIIIQTGKGQIFGVFLADTIKDQEEEALKKKFAKSRYYESTPILEGKDKNIDADFNLIKSASGKDKDEKSKNYFGSSDSFVFTLYPDTQKFYSTGENIFYCSYSESYLAVGGPATKPALQLDSSLSIGLSYCCPTYNNIPLHKGPPGEFRIQKIQCFAIY